MSLTFERPIGPCCDVSELEYISSLHQTDSEIRRDGSINAIDIVRFLSSRYGIHVSEDEVKRTILLGLGGGGDDEDCMDMVEIVAVLLIPYFLKSLVEEQSSSVPLSPETTNEAGGSSGATTTANTDGDKYENTDSINNKEVMKQVFHMILNDVTGSTTPPVLDKEMLIEILKFYGEHEIAHDDYLLDQMIIAATATSPAQQQEDNNKDGSENNTSSALVLDLASFTRALTFDVKKYDIEYETSYTSNYYDVFKVEMSSAKNNDNDPKKGRVPSEKTLPGEACRDDYDDEPATLEPSEKQFRTSPFKNEGSTTTVDANVSSSAIQPNNDSHDRLKISVISNDMTKDKIINKFSSKRQWEDDEQPNQQEHKSAQFDKKETMAPIDYTSDTFGSAIYISLVWACAISSYFTYVWGEVTNSFADLDCAVTGDYGCKLAQSLVFWLLTFTELSVMGTVFVGLCSVGVSQYGESVILLLLGMMTGIYCTIVPFFVQVQTPFFNTIVSDPVTRVIRYPTLILGILLMLMQLTFLLTLLFPQAVKERCEWVTEYLIDNIKRETNTKRATSSKINKMVNNAIHMCLLEDEDTTSSSNNTKPKHHTKNSKNYQSPKTEKVGRHKNSKNYQSRALLNFMKYDLKTEKVGGYLWTYKSLFTGELYRKDGVWISGRVFSGTAALITAVLGIITVFGVLTRQEYLADHQDDNMMSAFLGLFPSDDYDYVIEEDIDNQMSDVNVTGDTFTNVTENITQMVDSANSAINSDAIKNSKEIGTSFLVGCVLATILASFTSTIYIPSTVSTILKLRCGVIPSLHSKDFLKCRQAVDNVMYILGFMFWGVFFSSVTFGMFVSGIFYLFLSEDSRDNALHALISLTALAITLIFKNVFLMLFMRKSAWAFYRSKPRQANSMGLVFSCWSFGTSVGFMFIRVVKLIISTVLFIGRVDTPILAPNVGLFGFELDTAPATYMKDILAHEAHRHPYIERLGVMYLMKLRYGGEFAKTSGTIWRMLFVFALMPWLRQYRVMARPEIEDDDDIKSSSIKETLSSIKQRIVTISAKTDEKVRSILKSSNK